MATNDHRAQSPVKCVGANSVVIQDTRSKTMLMLAWMNKVVLLATIKTRCKAY